MLKINKLHSLQLKLLRCKREKGRPMGIGRPTMCPSPPACHFPLDIQKYLHYWGGGGKSVPTDQNFYFLSEENRVISEDQTGESACTKLLPKCIHPSTLQMLSPQKDAMSALRSQRLYFLPPCLISQQWNMGLCVHEMKASSENQ